MGRRGAKSNPITLFSFQDIITSVTGIMILVTLLMALELSQRQLQTPAVQTAVVVAELEPAVDEAQREVDELEARLAARDTELQELAGFDARRLHAETADAERQIARLESDVAQLETRARRAQEQRREIQTRQASRRADWDAAEELTRRLEAARRRLEKLRSSNRLIYNSPVGAAKSTWIVEVTDAAVSTAPLGVSAPATTFGADTASERLAAFLAWAAGRDRGSEYFVLLVKPSGITAFVELRDELGKLGFDLGFDVVAADQTIIDPDTGASF
ncbi:MAG TPA: hypothetical protein VMV69_15065 [Pirellulales bacterium]|nr:hypothetical protein [Pirellulales bacterium]